jgi:16S rRNA (cytosine967-C5)-methyltransferase
LAIGLAKSNPVSPARRVAFEILQRVADGAFSSVLLATKEPELEPADRALCHELVMGVLRRQLWLDHLIRHYSNRKVSDLDLPVRLILRLGLYQLRFLSRIPPSAAVNESVNLATVARVRSAGSFVNAVLRRATREPTYDPAASIEDPVDQLGVATSHPRWLIERWSSAFGQAEARAFAEANNEPAPTAFRVVRHRADASDILQRLIDAGAELTASDVVQDAWRIRRVNQLLLELAAHGQVYLQDEGSQLAATVLDAHANQKILDLCAAPGSKTTQVADIAGDSSEIVACDLYDHRLNSICAAAALQNLRNIRLLQLDGLQRLPFPEASFDRILLDAPCSGTGTFRRNPEIRWRISAADIEQLAKSQETLLKNAAKVLRRGGRLVYSTCSVEPEENEAVVAKFQAAHPEFQTIDLQVSSSLKTSTGAVRTWPHRTGSDGFFICAMERSS